MDYLVFDYLIDFNLCHLRTRNNVQIDMTPNSQND